MGHLLIFNTTQAQYDIELLVTIKLCLLPVMSKCSLPLSPTGRQLAKGVLGPHAAGNDTHTCPYTDTQSVSKRVLDCI